MRFFPAFNKFIAKSVKVLKIQSSLFLNYFFLYILSEALSWWKYFFDMPYYFDLNEKLFFYFAIFQ